MYVTELGSDESAALCSRGWRCNQTQNKGKLHIVVSLYGRTLTAHSNMPDLNDLLVISQLKRLRGLVTSETLESEEKPKTCRKVEEEVIVESHLNCAM